MTNRNTNIRIYIASALSNAELNSRIAESIAHIGAEYYLPQDDPVNKAPKVDGMAIAERNKSQIEDCDCLMVIYSKMGQDTSWEAGYAYGLGKAYFLICTEDLFNEAKASAMLFYSSEKVIVLPNWNISRNVFALKIKEAIQSLSAIELRNM